MTDRDPSEGTLERALAVAYRYLSRRERTEREVCEHLEARDFAAGIVSEAVAELCQLGYVNDARYAQLFAQDKRELEGWGSERIARTLRERGLAPDLIAAAVGDRDREQELEQALVLLRRRCPDPPRERRERDRALGILLRKGYESELAVEALQVHTSTSQARSGR